MKTRKTILRSLVVALIMVFAIASCNGGGTPTNNTPPPASTPESTPATPHLIPSPIFSSEPQPSAEPMETLDPVKTPTPALLMPEPAGCWYEPIVDAYAAFELSNHTVYDEDIISGKLLEDGLNNVKYGFPTASYTYALLDLSGSEEEVLLIGCKDYPINADCIYTYKDDGFEMILHSEYFRNSLRFYVDDMGKIVIEEYDNNDNPSKQYFYTIDSEHKAVLLCAFYLYGEYDPEIEMEDCVKRVMLVNGEEVEITIDEYNEYMHKYGTRGHYDTWQPRYIELDWKPVVNPVIVE